MDSKVWTQPRVLENEIVRLEPLEIGHSELLRPACAEDTFKFFLAVQPRSFDEVGFRAYVEHLLGYPNCQAFAVFHKPTGRYSALSTLMDIRPDAKGLEIGQTWITPSLRGTALNPSMKYLMLEHSFERVGCVRVQLKTDGRNVHSQTAIRKLGAKYEGILRKHGITLDGFIRDTVMFSITDEEWPEVKQNLQTRLAAILPSELNHR